MESSTPPVSPWASTVAPIAGLAGRSHSRRSALCAADAGGARTADAVDPKVVETREAAGGHEGRPYILLSSRWRGWAGVRSNGANRTGKAVPPDNSKSAPKWRALYSSN